MRRTRPLGRRSAVLGTALAAALITACSSGDAIPAEPAATAATSTTAAASTTTGPGRHPAHDSEMEPTDRAAAQLATAAYQDLDVAEAAGYTSTIDTLGCFQDPATGGRGVHYLDATLMDAEVSIAQPEALVYELDTHGAVTGLVAHEYIVPVDAWTSTDPPSLFGAPFHRHPTLPLWVLHTWLWKDNPNGVFADWNTAVRMCPDGVPIFGRDLPADPVPTTASS